ncbi:MAG: hypothetical protein Q8K12_02380 [Thiobacillus sp.]|nr:hypothetical protein [Thiobacillus sp.]
MVRRHASDLLVDHRLPRNQQHVVDDPVQHLTLRNILTDKTD